MDDKDPNFVTKVPTCSVKVIRDERRVSVAAGQTFDFTEEEVTQINGARKGALRDPVVEKTAKAKKTDEAAAGTDDAKGKKPAKPADGAAAGGDDDL